MTYKTSLSCLKYNEKDNLSPPSYWQLVRNEAKIPWTALLFGFRNHNVAWSVEVNQDNNPKL